MALPIYKGPFGPAQAERLLWRAGFGPRRGEAKALAARGLNGAVLSLTRPGRDLDDYGNLKPVVDVRSVYCSLLEQWFGVDAAGVIPDAASIERRELVS